MGDKLCHKNEAPFPERLAGFFIHSLCPLMGTVLDPFSGSGTTVKVAAKLGRRGIGVDLSTEYLGEVTDARMGDGFQMELVR